MFDKDIKDPTSTNILEINQPCYSPTQPTMLFTHPFIYRIRNHPSTNTTTNQFSSRSPTHTTTHTTNHLSIPSFLPFMHSFINLLSRSPRNQPNNEANIKHIIRIRFTVCWTIYTSAFGVPFVTYWLRQGNAIFNIYIFNEKLHTFNLHLALITFYLRLFGIIYGKGQFRQRERNLLAFHGLAARDPS